MPEKSPGGGGEGGKSELNERPRFVTFIRPSSTLIFKPNETAAKPLPKIKKYSNSSSSNGTVTATYGFQSNPKAIPASPPRRSLFVGVKGRLARKKVSTYKFQSDPKVVPSRDPSIPVLSNRNQILSQETFATRKGSSLSPLKKESKSEKQIKRRTKSEREFSTLFHRRQELKTASDDSEGDHHEMDLSSTVNSSSTDAKSWKYIPGNNMQHRQKHFPGNDVQHHGQKNFPGKDEQHRPKNIPEKSSSTIDPRVFPVIDEAGKRKSSKVEQQKHKNSDQVHLPEKIGKSRKSIFDQNRKISNVSNARKSKSSRDQLDGYLASASTLGGTTTRTSEFAAFIKSRRLLSSRAVKRAQHLVSKEYFSDKTVPPKSGQPKNVKDILRKPSKTAESKYEKLHQLESDLILERPFTSIYSVDRLIIESKDSTASSKGESSKTFSAKIYQPSEEVNFGVNPRDSNSDESKLFSKVSHVAKNDIRHLIGNNQNRVKGYHKNKRKVYLPKTRKLNRKKKKWTRPKRRRRKLNSKNKMKLNGEKKRKKKKWKRRKRRRRK